MKIEIGPGEHPLAGFVRVGHPASPGGVDIACDARRLPLADDSCELVYSCHCVEHVEWHEVEDTVREWVRVVAPGGVLEIHTVDAGNLMARLVNWRHGESPEPRHIWRKLCRGRSYEALVAPLMNSRADPGVPGSEAWMSHRALITASYLRYCMERAGLHRVGAAPMRADQNGLNREWFNLGMAGVKA